MEDTTPLEIVSGTGPTTADPVRSLWQTASVGVRMLMDVSWSCAAPAWCSGSTPPPGNGSDQRAGPMMAPRFHPPCQD
jgi:hypothetical protein